MSEENVPVVKFKQRKRKNTASIRKRTREDENVDADSGTRDDGQTNTTVVKRDHKKNNGLVAATVSSLVWFWFSVREYETDACLPEQIK